VLVETGGSGDEGPTATDPEASPADVTTYTGMPEFEHVQWTVEGEIERFGAFARGSHHVRGWRRGLAVLLAVSFIAPIAIGIVVGVIALVSRMLGL
jgi:hypothetical protein